VVANYVEIQVKASDTAKPDLTDLKAKLDELGAKVETAKVDVDDADGTAKLLAMNAKLAALNAKVANPRISISGAAKAEADLAALDAQMRNAGTASEGAKTRFGAFGQAVNALTLGVPGGISEMTMFQKAVAGLGVATGLGEPLVAGLTVAVGSLGAGLVSAGAGLGAFGVIAKANLGAAGTAAKQVQTAQDTYNASIAAGMPKAKAYAAEQKAIALAYAELTPAQITLSKQVGNLSNQWQGFTASFAPMISGMLSKIQPVLGTIFGAIGKLATSAGNAISALLPSLDMAIKGSGFQKFIQMLADNAGPAIVKIGVAIGHVATGIGGILSAFMPMSQGMLSGVDKITAAFAKWGTTLSSHTGFQSMMSTFKTETPQAIAVLKNLAIVVKNVVSGMAGLATGSNSMTLLNVLKPLSGILASLSKNTDLVRIGLYLLAAADAGKKLHGAIGNVQDALRGLDKGVNLLGKLGGAAEDAGRGAKIAAAGTKIWSGIQAAFNIIMDANPIFLVIGAITLLVAGIILAYTHFKTFRDIVNDVGNAIKTGFLDAFNFVKGAVSDVVNFVSDHWKLLVAIILGPLGLIIDAMVTHWSGVKTGFQDCYNFVAGIIRSAIGVIKAIITPYIQWNEAIFKALWDAATAVFKAGWAAISAVVSGGVAAVKAAVNWFSGLAKLFGGWMSAAFNEVSRWLTTLVDWFWKLPGWINNALGGMPGMLFQAGVKAIEGLLNGAASMIGHAVSVAASWGHDIVNALGSAFGIHFSEPSEAALVVKAGRNIAAGLGAGLLSGKSAVASAAAQLSGAVAISGTGTAGGPGGAAYGGKLQLELTSTGDQFLIWLRNSIRVKGGNVQTVLGTG
jgi:phage-related protein